MMLPRLPRTCKRQNDLVLKANTSKHRKGKSSTCKKNNQLQQKSLHAFEESYAKDQALKKETQKISSTSTPIKQCSIKLFDCNRENTTHKLSGRKKICRKEKDLISEIVLFGSENESSQSKQSINLRSRHSISLEENSNNLKDKEKMLPRLPRTCKGQNDQVLKVNNFKHSKIKEKSSTCKKNNQLQKKSQHTFEELYEISKKKSQNMSAASTPVKRCSVKLININLENTPDKVSGRKKKNSISRAVSFASEIENTQLASKLSKNLRSTCSTPLEENSNNLKEEGISRRQLRRSKQSVNHSTNSVLNKMGRKPLMCKKNIMEEDKSEENLEDSCFQNDDFNQTSHDLPVTSTPLVPYQRKTKKLKNLNTCNQSLPKRTSTKRKRSICISSFKMPNESAISSVCDLILTRRYSESPKETCNNSSAQIMEITKHTKKSSTKGQKGKQLKRHTFCDEYPIDDLSLTKTVRNTRKVKSDGFKAPGKNTLKRKRYVFSEFHKANEGYEDDIYESQEFECFKDILQDTTFSDESFSMPTPKFGCTVTPRVFPKTPIFKDCISPTEYAITKKIAEECLYRNKKKKNTSHEETADVPEKKKLEFDEALENIQMQEKVFETIMEEARSDKEDSYLSD